MVAATTLTALGWCFILRAGYPRAPVPYRQVLLSGYGIAVTFHTVMAVMGGNSIANTVSVTPGG